MITEREQRNIARYTAEILIGQIDKVVEHQSAKDYAASHGCTEQTVRDAVSNGSLPGFFWGGGTGKGKQCTVMITRPSVAKMKVA